jgi:DNA-binding MarR family transcriptional regulator
MKAKNFKDLLTYRLNVLAHLSSKLASLVNQVEFQLAPREWRMIGLLGQLEQLSLQRLAIEVDVDKSQASRMVSSLIDRGYLKRLIDAKDARGILLSLTSKGQSTFERAFPSAVDRNETLLRALTQQERVVFERCLDKLTLHAKKQLEELREAINSTSA